MTSGRKEYRKRRSGAGLVAAMYGLPILAGAAVIGFAGVTSTPAGPTVVEAPIAAMQPVANEVPTQLAGTVVSDAVTGSIAIDPNWLNGESAQTQIPLRALQAYAAAEIVARQETPDCHLAWNTLAALGWIESGHGSHADAVLQADGTTSHPILGPALDGSDDLAAIRATPETEAATGDPDWDHAVGPMQFIGSTWSKWGADANGDGAADPNNIDDAALTAAHYLCAGGRDLSTGEGWSKAIRAYNHSDAYVDAVRTAANGFVGS